MKRLLMVAVLVLAMSVPAFAFDAFTFVEAGGFSQYGETVEFGLLAGLEVPLYADPTKGFAVVSQGGIFYSGGAESDIQGMSLFEMNRKTIGVWKQAGLYVALGGGYLYRVLDGDDDHNGAIKLETGVTVWGNFTVGVSGTFMPIKGQGDDGFFALKLDLSP